MAASTTSGVNTVLERSAMRHYIRFASTDTWFWLGDDNDDFAISMNWDTETKRNIKGQTRTTVKGCSPSGSVDPYYAKPGDVIYPYIRNIAMQRKEASAEILEVIVEGDDTIIGYTEDIIVTVPEYGKGNEATQFPFEFSFNGNRKSVTVSISNNVPTVSTGA